MSRPTGIYEIEEILESDEFAVLCIAREHGVLEGRPVTLKVIRNDVTDQSLLVRVHDEARMLGRLNHPGIVHVFRLLTYAGRPVVEMEVLRGLTVQQLIERYPNGLGLDDAVKIARRVVLALEAAYSRPDGPDGQAMNIIHRNLQPANVLITTDGDVKVMDFILAKGEFPDRRAVSFELTPAMQRFAAPEVGMVRVTPAIDIYAAGNLLFEMVSGHTLAVPPAPEFYAELLEERIVALHPECLSPVALRRLQELLRGMLRWDPQERPLHRDVAEELEEILDTNESTHGLQTFARHHVRAEWENRKVVPPPLHPDYDEVAFLEIEAPDAADRESVQLNERQVERQLWTILSDPGWVYRVTELQDLVIGSGHRPVAPFLAVLDRADVPQWRFWSKKASPEEICAALSVFAQSPDPTIVERARVLMDHGDPSVARAAKHIVMQAETPER